MSVSHIESAFVDHSTRTLAEAAPVIAAPEINDSIAYHGGQIITFPGAQHRLEHTTAPTLKDMAELVNSNAPAAVIDAAGAMCIRSMRTGEADAVDIELLRDVDIPEHHVDLELARRRLFIARISLWRETKSNIAS